jgi:hypothetical protein
LEQKTLPARIYGFEVNMRKPLLIAMLAGALMALTSCDLEDWGDFSGTGRYTQDFHYSYPLKPGGSLSLESFNGTIEISGWDDSSVEINGTKYAPTPELRDAIKIDVSATPDSIYIRTVRPSERRGSMGARFTIRVPRKTRLERITGTNGSIRVQDVEGAARLKTTNGSVRAQKVLGALEVQTSNGGIEVVEQDGGATLRTSNGRIRAENVRGGFEAFTTNGGVSAQVAHAEAGRPIRVETTNGGVDLALTAEDRGDVRVSTSNGGITLHLPEKTNARVMASTSNSSIRSEFDVQTQGTTDKHHMDGVIGAGGPAWNLSTTNGTIRLLKQ